MTDGHYFFKLDHWFHAVGCYVPAFYDFGYFEIKGHVMQGIREGISALTNSRGHKNQNNHFIKEVIVSVPDFYLLRSSGLINQDNANLVKGFTNQKSYDEIKKVGMLISYENVNLPFLHDINSLPTLHHCKAKANFHLSHNYFYISCVDEIINADPPVYFQSRKFDVALLGLESMIPDLQALNKLSQG